MLTVTRLGRNGLLLLKEHNVWIKAMACYVVATGTYWQAVDLN
jgi:hypothetical protein